jgi:hypothetical protein
LEQPKAKESERAAQSGQFAQIERKRSDGRGHRPMNVAGQIAGETGFHRSTVNRALGTEATKSAASPEDDPEACYSR